MGRFSSNKTVAVMASPVGAKERPGCLPARQQQEH